MKSWFSDRINSIRIALPLSVKQNVVAAISFSRIVLTPVVVWLILIAQWKWAVFVFFIAAATDGLDGFVARLLKARSRFGLYLDTIADKILVSSVLLALVFFTQRVSSWAIWAIIIIVVRELMIISLKIGVKRRGAVVHPSWSGKIKMGVECVAITLVLWRPWESGWFGLPWGDWMLMAAALLSVQSGLSYFIRYRGMFAQQDVQKT